MNPVQFAFPPAAGSTVLFDASKAYNHAFYGPQDKIHFHGKLENEGEGDKPDPVESELLEEGRIKRPKLKKDKLSIVRQVVGVATGVMDSLIDLALIGAQWPHITSGQWDWDTVFHVAGVSNGAILLLAAGIFRAITIKQQNQLALEDMRQHRHRFILHKSFLLSPKEVEIRAKDAAELEKKFVEQLAWWGYRCVIKDGKPVLTRLDKVEHPDIKHRKKLAQTAVELYEEMRKMEEDEIFVGHPIKLALQTR